MMVRQAWSVGILAIHRSSIKGFHRISFFTWPCVGHELRIFYQKIKFISYFNFILPVRKTMIRFRSINLKVNTVHITFLCNASNILINRKSISPSLWRGQYISWLSARRPGLGSRRSQVCPYSVLCSLWQWPWHSADHIFREARDSVSVQCSGPQSVAPLQETYRRAFGFKSWRV